MTQKTVRSIGVYRYPFSVVEIKKQIMTTLESKKFAH